MQNKKNFLIQAQNLISFEGRAGIPTALYFEAHDQALFGHIAVEKSQHVADTQTNSSILNSRFKLDLGRLSPKIDVFNRDKFATACGVDKSAVELTKTFVDKVMDHVVSSIKKVGWVSPNAVMVAEPLAFQISEEKESWLSNYRKHLRDILSSRYKQISFLPEPFAVFQYYRYGLRHPLLVGKQKHICLVVDFGGGTFDVSVIETSASGDVSLTGRHSKPLAAVSMNVGGYYINQRLAEHLLIKQLQQQDERKRASKCINQYGRWKSGNLDIFMLSDNSQAFLRNMDRVSESVEIPKISLTSLVGDWKLTGSVTGSVRVMVPVDPFSIDSKTTLATLTNEEFRDIFINSIWNARLKKVINSAIKKAEEELQGRKIGVLLLSGGSANIRWLHGLLGRDFPDSLSDINVVTLTEDYQQIVAKGLAIECARRFHDPNSEFRSVTYNTLCLVLNPNDGGEEKPRYKCLIEPFTQQDTGYGVLLPSASVLREFFDHPISWKVRLKQPPTRFLRYHFLKTSLDPDDFDNLFNVDQIVHTKPKTRFESSLEVEITVSRDGTCRPRFIYRHAYGDRSEISEQGAPFFIDLTFDEGDSEDSENAYVGLDFGTCNTSVSYVNETQISSYEERSADSQWVDLADVVDELPFPIAKPMKTFLGEVDQEKSAKQALTVVESFLTFGAYITLMELAGLKGLQGLFKDFSTKRRSSGPLKDVFEKALHALGEEAQFSKPFQKLFTVHLDVLTNGLRKLVDHKHDKIPASEVNVLPLISTLARVFHEAMQDHEFGYFQDVKKIPFQSKFNGTFFAARGVPPFARLFDYCGEESYSEDQTFLVDISSGTALLLSPLMFWEMESGTYNQPRNSTFDSFDQSKEEYLYKQVDDARTTKVNSANYESLVIVLNQLRDGVTFQTIFSNVSLSRKGGVEEMVY